MHKAFIFDWSGTLCDNFHCWEKVCGLMFEELGKNPLTADEIRAHFTLPYMNFWYNFFPSITHEFQHDLYVKYMHQGGPAELFTGSENIINYLLKQNYLLFILSSDENETLLPHMNRLGLTKKFKKIIGSIHEKKTVLANLVKEFELDKNKTYYVGDTSGDVEAGKFAGVKTIGVSWGYQKKELLAQSQPDYLIDDILEIQNIV